MEENLDQPMASKSNARTWGCAAILFAVNVFVCRELFYTAYIPAMSSVEGSFIALSRYAMSDMRDLHWLPLWFLGMPWLNAYPPGVPMSVALLAKVFHLAPALVFHALMGLFYCLGPVALFWMCYGFTGLRGPSLMTGLIYSLFSPSAMVPVVHTDLASVFFARRFQALTAYGEGPHVATMTMMPLVVLSLHRAMTARRPIYRILVSFCMVSIAVTNWTGTIGLALMLLAYCAAYGPHHNKAEWLWAGALACLAYGICSPWLPPSTLRTVLMAAQHANGHFPFSLWHAAILCIVVPAMAGIIIVMRRLGVSEFLEFTGLLTVITGGIYLSWRVLGFAILPQPHRWLLEFEMGVIPLAVFSAFQALQRLSSFSRKAALAAVLMFMAVQLKVYRKYCGDALEPVDIFKTSEYKEARWFDAHMEGGRVFAPGSVALWMNVFTDTTQFAGCCDQALKSDLVVGALYAIYNGPAGRSRDVENSLRWLKAFGVQAIAVSKHGSSEPYQSFKDPGKFDGVLMPMWQEGGDVVYAVPQKSHSLAHVVEPESLVSRRPIHGQDTEPLIPYLQALEDPSLPAVDYQWTSRHSARLTAEQMKRDQVISVQETYDEGWHATVNGFPQAVTSDALGMIAIRPKCDGKCVVDLFWDRREERRFCNILRLASLAGLILLAWRR